jgi:hypothetical protein
MLFPVWTLIPYSFHMDLEREDKLSDYFIVATFISCIGQVFWFASKCFTQIDYDGMSYVGIARHLSHGQFHAAISAFRSPLISWIIAAGSLLDGDLLRVGKFTSIGSFFASTAPVFYLAKRLWHSRLVASIAGLWFSLVRGLAATSVITIVPDLLLTALVLIYFLILLRCLRTDRAIRLVPAGICPRLGISRQGIRTTMACFGDSGFAYCVLPRTAAARVEPARSGIGRAPSYSWQRRP